MGINPQMHSCGFLYFKSFLMYQQSECFCERSAESATNPPAPGQSNAIQCNNPATRTTWGLNRQCASPKRFFFFAAVVHAVWFEPSLNKWSKSNIISFTKQCFCYKDFVLNWNMLSTSAWVLWMFYLILLISHTLFGFRPSNLFTSYECP